MKQIALFFLLLSIFAGCKDSNEDASAAASEMKVLSDDKAAMAETAIPYFDYDSLERQYLLKENDTTYVLNFWATWCKPCVKELPAFEKINSEYSDKKVKVVLVSLDFRDKVESHVVPFMEKRELESEVVLLDDDDMNRWIPLISEEWTGAIPATLIVKNGAKYFYERSFTYTEIENELLTML